MTIKEATLTSERPYEKIANVWGRKFIKCRIIGSNNKDRNKPTNGCSS